MITTSVRIASCTTRALALGAMSLVLLAVLEAPVRAQGTQSIDLGLAVLDAPDPVAPGKLLSYRITLSREGRSQASNVRLEMAVPAGTTYEAARAPRGWTITPPQLGTTLPFAATIPSIPPGDPLTFLVSFRVSGTYPVGESVDATISVTSASSDPNQSNNSANASTLVAQSPPPEADLSLSIDPLQEPVTRGNLMILMLRVDNDGPMAATDVEVRTSTPQGTVFAGVALTQGDATTPDLGQNGEIVCDLDVVPAHKIVFITLLTKVVADPGANLEAIGQVTGSSTDRVPANNFARSTTRVVPVGPTGDLAISIDAPPSALSFRTIPMSVRVTNNGPVDVINASVLFPIPRSTRFLSASVTQGGDPRTPPVGRVGAVGWRPGAIAPGATATLTVTLAVVARAGTRLEASAVVTSDANDTSLANNVASASARVQSLGDAQIQWDPPDPGAGASAPPMNVMVTPSSQATPAKRSAPEVNATRDESSTVLCYNVYTSNSPDVETTPENLWTTVPPNETVVTGSVAPGGSFFTVTAQYADGESSAANSDGTGDVPGPTISSLKVTSSKITATGTGFTSTVEVLFDGIPFTVAAKVKKNNTKAVQKGSLVISETVDQYTAGGGSFLVIFRNADGGLTSVTYDKQ